MHMRRIKRILIFAALLVIVLLITGCGINACNEAKRIVQEKDNS